MKKTQRYLLLILISASMLLHAQVSPFLKKYSGAYHLLNFGEETATASSEKITLTLDGKWTSISFPVDDNGVISKVSSKKAGTWMASDGLIQISIVANGATTVSDFKLDGGLFLGSSTFLKKIFMSNPAFVAKYAGAYYILRDGEEKANEFTETITFKPDGKCILSTPAVDDNGVVTKTPVIAQGTWKANDGTIQMIFVDQGEERMTEYNLNNNTFVNRLGDRLNKALPPSPPVNYLLKYAGSYNMLVEGQTANAQSDKYVFTPDGNCTWTRFASCTPIVTKGTWKASDGLIQMYFSNGDSDKGSELLTDFKWQNGVFRAEGVFLKKIEMKTNTIKK